LLGVGVTFELKLAHWLVRYWNTKEKC